MRPYFQNIDPFVSAQHAIDFYKKNEHVIKADSYRSLDTSDFQKRFRKLLSHNKHNIAALHIILKTMFDFVNDNKYLVEWPLQYYIKSSILFMLGELYIEKEKTEEECLKLHEALSDYMRYPEWHFFKKYCEHYKIMNELDENDDGLRKPSSEYVRAFQTGDHIKPVPGKNLLMIGGCDCA